MHGQPPGVDFSMLVGQRLIQLCFGEHQIQLHFDGCCSITADIELEVLTRKKVRLAATDARKALLDLLGRSPQTSAFVDRKTFVMKFDEGSTIILRDDSTQYESFQIRLGEGLYVI